MKGKAIIFSAPSGAGKTTIVKNLLRKIPSLRFSISATTRNKRANEVPGKDYYFLGPEDFQKKVKTNEFLEWEEVYKGAFYGTLRSEVERIWSDENHVIFDVDVKGGLKLKEAFKDDALAIFVKVPNLDILTNRLENRNTEDAGSLKKRIAKAEEEMVEESKFDEVVINERLEMAIEDAYQLVQDFIDN